MLNKNKKESKKLTLLELISLAVGTIIGASIFTLLSLGIKLSGTLLPLSFLISGFLALLVAYSYANLAKKIISNAGPIAFILKGFGDNVFVGTLAVLMWFSYVISLALFAKGFAIYFCPIFNIKNYKIVEILILLIFMIINFFGSKAIGKLEKYMVAIKVGILLFFIFIGGITIKKINLSYYDLKGVFLSSLLFFLSYMGFGLVTNASENAENPEKNVPKAIYFSILIVLLIYLGVSFVAAQQSLSLNQYGENLLAIIIEKYLGKIGYLIVSLGAILSTLSALNASLYGGANIAYSLAKKGELPKFFERKIWFNEPEGLYITTFLAIVITTIFNLQSVASIISLTFLIIYIFTVYSHLKLIKKGYPGNKYLVKFSFLVLLLNFLGFLLYNLKNNPKVFLAFTISFLISLFLELILRFGKKRDFKKFLLKIKEVEVKLKKNIQKAL